MGANIESWDGDCDGNESRSTVAAEQADLRRGEEADWRQTQNSSTSQLDRKIHLYTNCNNSFEYVKVS